MQRDCYRCGHPLEERLAFCPACGAPQIRVSIAPQQPSPPPDGLGADLTSTPSAPLPPELASLAVAGIEWKYFFRTAAPLAAFTGMLTVPLALLGFFVLLPASLIWTIARYRQHRPTPLRGGQGARMGACMGLLSFGFFLVFFLGAVFLNQAMYREMIISVVRDRAAQASDLQSQQMLQWFATPDGLITFTAVFLAFTLCCFVIIGLGSGALAVALGKTRNRSEL